MLADEDFEEVSKADMCFQSQNYLKTAATYISLMQIF